MLVRRFLRWQMKVARGSRRILAQGVFAALAMLMTCCWVVLQQRELAATSVLHPATPFLASLNAQIEHSAVVTRNGSLVTTDTMFPQYGAHSMPGRHFRLENVGLLTKQDAVLLVLVLKDAESWGEGRSADSFFELLESFDFPKRKISVTVLTSSMSEFLVMQRRFTQQSEAYPRLSLIFRDDFSPQDVVTRENRHDHGVQVDRRRVIARYRNYALLSTMEPWHQHVMWLDADVHKVPSKLLKKMAQSGLDVVEPMCVRMKENGEDWYEYDLNAWVGRRKARRSARDTSFVPGDLSVRRMKQFHGVPDTFVPLDSVGGTMLYVKADVHRQGVLFPVHHLIGSEWESEGYDGIETEGLCYVAHFLGFKCWGMPNDLIFHI